MYADILENIRNDCNNTRYLSIGMTPMDTSKKSIKRYFLRTFVVRISASVKSCQSSK